MKRFAALLSLLVFPFAEASETAPLGFDTAVQQLRSAVGLWDVETTQYADDGAVARVACGTYRFDWVVPDRVLAGRSDIPDWKQSAGILFYVNERRSAIEMASVGTDGQLQVMRVTRFNVSPDRLEARMEVSTDGGSSWKPTKISFINEIANLCEKIGCDVHDVARAMGMDKRIGSKFLHPGPGFGGSCFPKDTRALASVARQFGAESLMVDAVIEVNRRQRSAMLPKIEKLVGAVKGKTIAVLGLAFKPETNDIREAPALDIIQGLLERGAKVRAYDPVAMEETAKVISNICYAEDEYEAVNDADALVIVTEWNQFRALDMKRIRDLMKSPRIADLRNIYEPDDLRELGFEYAGVGR